MAVTLPRQPLRTVSRFSHGVAAPLRTVSRFSPQFVRSVRNKAPQSASGVA